MIDMANGAVEIMPGISDALGMTPLVVDKPVIDVTPEASAPIAHLTIQQQQADNDFNESRATLKAIIKEGMDSLATAILFAGASEKASSYQHVASLIKEINDANQNLLALHQARRDLAPQTQDEAEASVDNGAKTVNHNNVFVVSSPNDLLAMVRSAIDKSSTVATIPPSEPNG